MAIRTGEAVWNGNLAGGGGRLKTQTESVNADYSAGSRFREDPGTNPEELIAAAHAGCFSMALAGRLAEMKIKPQRIRTTASVHLERQDGKHTITRIDLDTEAEVPDIDPADFQEAAEWAKKNCPVSRLLKPEEGVTLRARLVSEERRAAS